MTHSPNPNPNPNPNLGSNPAVRPDATLRVRSDRHLIRAVGRSERYLLIDVVAPTVERDPARRRPPVNLGFVLDRSGSMGGSGKLSLAKQAALEAIGRLEPGDRFAVVTYDDQVDVVLGGMLATPEARRMAADRLRPIAPRNNTNLHGGWITGCDQVASGLLAEGVNRVLLLTDGLANSGICDPDELGRQAHELRRRGVTTSTFGVGIDFDESLLQGMADSGGGHFYFIGDVAQMRDHITSEVGDTLEVVARDVVVEVEVPASVTVTSLSPFRIERSGDTVRVYLGDLVSGQVLPIALQLVFDYGEIGREVGVRVRLADRDRVFEAAGPAARPATVAWAYADHPANDTQPRDVDVDRFVTRLVAEQAKQEAVSLNRQGRFDEARSSVALARGRVEAAAGDDEVMHGLVAELTVDAAAYAAPMPEMERKMRHFASSTISRSRTADGKPRKA